MFVGFDNTTERGLKFNLKQPKLAVDLGDKLVTAWGKIKNPS
jgi:hypothetical protein